MVFFVFTHYGFVVLLFFVDFLKISGKKFIKKKTSKKHSVKKRQRGCTLYDIICGCCFFTNEDKICLRQELIGAFFYFLSFFILDASFVKNLQLKGKTG